MPPLFEGKQGKAERALAEREPRFAALSPEDRALYQKLKGWRKEHNGMSAFSDKALEEQDIVWDNFIYGLLNIKERSLLPYVENKESFPADRFALVPVFATDKKSYDPKTKYGLRGGPYKNPLAGYMLNIDAPFAVVLMYRNDEKRTYAPDEVLASVSELIDAELPETAITEWETVSVMGVTPDFSHNALLGDQLQGGDTSGTPMGKDAYKARLKFVEGSPEYALYLLMKDFAKECGFSLYGLRKPETNDWPAVSQRADKGLSTLYDKVMDLRREEAARSAFSEADAQTESLGLKDYFLERFVQDSAS